MSVRTIIANVTSPGDINFAVIRIEGEMKPMKGTPGDRSASILVDVEGELDILFVLNALFGTQWKLVLSREGEEPFFTRKGKTDTKNSSIVIESIPFA